MGKLSEEYEKAHLKEIKRNYRADLEKQAKEGEKKPRVLNPGECVSVINPINRDKEEEGRKVKALMENNLRQNWQIKEQKRATQLEENVEGLERVKRDREEAERMKQIKRETKVKQAEQLKRAYALQEAEKKAVLDKRMELDKDYLMKNDGQYFDPAKERAHVSWLHNSRSVPSNCKNSKELIL